MTNCLNNTLFSVEECFETCVKNDIVPRCGVELYEVLQKMQTIEDHLLALTTLDQEPDVNKKCFDIPMVEVPINKDNLGDGAMQGPL